MLPLVGVELALSGQERINDEVTHARYEVLFHTQVTVREHLIEVLLQDLKANCVSFFVNAIVAAVFLETVVSKVHVVVAVCQIVIIR